MTSLFALLLCAIALLARTQAQVNRACSLPGHTDYVFCNTSLSIDARVADLVAQLATSEKPGLMVARHSQPIGRLGIPAYDWGVNSIHGTQVSCGERCGTNFALPTAVGASFNTSLVEGLGRMQATEQRALRLEGSRESHRRRLSEASQDTSAMQDALIGLDTWAPNLNLQRDPRWGRNWEVASEDPFVTGAIGAAYARGFQTDPEGGPFLLGVLTIKHWAVYTVEANRNGYNSVASPFDLADSYLPAFRAAVTEGKAAGVMCSCKPYCDDWVCVRVCVCVCVLLHLPLTHSHSLPH